MFVRATEPPKGWSIHSNHSTDGETKVKKKYKDFTREELPALYSSAGLIEGLFEMFSGLWCHGSLTLTITEKSHNLTGSLVSYLTEDTDEAKRLVAEILKESSFIVEKFRHESFSLQFDFSHTYNFGGT